MNTNILLYTEKIPLIEDINYYINNDEVEIEQKNCIQEIP